MSSIVSNQNEKDDRGDQAYRKVTTSNLDVIAKEEECTSKWRHLALTPLSTDPIVLQLQRSLANAALENELLNSKLSKIDAEIERKNQEVSSLKSELLHAQEQMEVLHVQAEGGNTDLDLMRDKIVTLEKKLVTAEGENSHLTARLDLAVTAMKRDNMNQCEAEAIREENENLYSSLAELQMKKKMLEQVIAILLFVLFVTNCLM